MGIDLGTTNSCMGVWNFDHDTVEILANDLGMNTTPFCNDIVISNNICITSVLVTTSPGVSIYIFRFLTPIDVNITILIH